MPTATPAPTQTMADETVFTQEDWSRTVRGFVDANLYQTWAYGSVHGGPSQTRHCVVLRDGVVAAAAQVRVVRLPILGAGVAHVFWGPLWRSVGAITMDEGLLREMVVRLRETYTAKRGMMLRIVPPVFEGTPDGDVAHRVLMEEGFQRRSGGRVYRTLRLDLEPSPARLRSNLAQKWRNQLNRAERNEIETAEGHGLDLYDEFMTVYREMMGRKTFDTNVDVDDMRAVQERLADPCKMHMTIGRCAGRACAAVVVAALGDTGIYLLGATNKEGMRSKASYVLHWRALQWLRETGRRWYDLGGINPEGNPGVYHFKKGFSGADMRQMGCYELAPSAAVRGMINVGEKLRSGLRRVRR